MALQSALAAALVLLVAQAAHAYRPHDIGPKEHYISDVLLREVVERMGKDLAEAPDSYEDFPGLMARSAKDMGEQFDYESLSDGNPNPSIRDQEYMHHSSLLAQYLANGGDGDEGSLSHNSALSRPVQVKPDAALPAYCNPPNPCPVGYREEQGCITNFENTAAFSREYQSEQECMCDSEHMFECNPNGAGTGAGVGQGEGGLDSYLQHQLQLDEHKNLVAKKFHAKKSLNPYLTGERLPVAAKKGNNVDILH